MVSPKFYNFSLMSGSRIVCHCWTALPMPQEVILCVSQIGHAQGTPSHITYVNRGGNEISDHLEDFVDDDDDDGSLSESDDDTYTENGSDQDSEDDGTTVSNNETTSSEDDNDDDSQGNPDPAADDKTTGSNDGTTSSDVDDNDNPQDNPHPPANVMHDPVVPDPAASLNPVGPDDDGDEDHGDANRAVNMDIPVVDRIEGSIGEGVEWEGECGNDASSNATSTGKMTDARMKTNVRVTLPPVSRPPRSRPPKVSSSRLLKQPVGLQQAPRCRPPKARYWRLLKQPVRPQQAPTMIHNGNQPTVNDVCPQGRESPQATQHCNIWSQRSRGIPPIDSIWRKICGAHLTTIFSPCKCLPREVCASLDKKGPMR